VLDELHEYSPEEATMFEQANGTIKTPEPERVLAVLRKFFAK